VTTHPDVHDAWRSGRLSILATALAACYQLQPQSVPPPQLAAQVPPAATTPDSITEDTRRYALERLKPGSAVRVWTTGTLREGKVLRLVDDSLVFEGGGSPSTAIPVAEIDSLWVRHGHAGTGALVGALLGAAGVGAFMVAENDTDESNAVVFSLGALIGAVPGAIVGGVAGSQDHSWVRQYP